MALKTLEILLLLALALSVQGAHEIIDCEKLEPGICAFAVSSSSKRCVLEKQVKRSGEEAYMCRTSEIEADGLSNYVETEQCVRACGIDRKTLGISSDSLLDLSFTQRLCSSPCYENCSNIVDLYFDLAAGEGVFLPKLCEAQEGREGRSREMAEIRSSGFAVNPNDGDFPVAPAASPTQFPI